MNLSVYWLVALITLFTFHSVVSSPTVISDDRVRGLDVSPALGRGYSIGTGQFQSTCLNLESTSEPSYNYDYYFTDLTTDDKSESKLSGKVSGSFGYWGVKAAVSGSYKQSNKTDKQTHHVVSTMRIERYYSSILEHKATLSDDALTLLNNEDYVGFFKSCGPNYVRSIRRAQEVTAIFSFEASNTESAKEFATSITASGWGQKVTASGGGSNSNKSINSSLTIKIVGYGLGLNAEGSQTLVATTLEDYKEVMKFAFNSMTKKNTAAGDSGGETGMVYGMEVVPWTDNTSFQVAAKLLDYDVMLDVPYHLIPNEPCKQGLMKDDFAKCCEPNQIVDIEDIKKVKKKECKPKRSVAPSMMKNNMLLNGEFVAMMDSLVRHKMNLFLTLQQCVSMLHGLPDRLDNYFLKTQDTVRYDSTLELQITVSELKIALDPLGDYSAVEIIGEELDEFVSMFYDPCLSALYSTGDDSLHTDSKYFLAKPWYQHPQCRHFSCLADNMRWDQESGGCKVGRLNVKPTDYSSDTSNATNCEKKKKDDNYVCNPERKTIYDKIQKMKECNDKVTDKEQKKQMGVPALTLVNYFCMPQIGDGGEAEDGEKKKTEELATQCKSIK